MFGLRPYVFDVPLSLGILYPPIIAVTGLEAAERSSALVWIDLS
jgi:hypothetical protein